jgi:hypothetical protein
MHVTSTSTPYAYFKEAKPYRTHDISSLVEQDVLLLAAAEDHYVPLHLAGQPVERYTFW